MFWGVEIYTDRIDECVDFYCNYFGFTEQERVGRFSVLAHPEIPGHTLLFCEPNSRFVDPIFHSPFDARGIIFQCELDEVDTLFAAMTAAGEQVETPLLEEPFNGRHFAVRDPAGMLVDVAVKRVRR